MTESDAEKPAPAGESKLAEPSSSVAEAPPTSASKPPRRPPPPPPKGLPLLGGRLGIGVVMLTAIAIIAPQRLNACVDRTLFPAEPKPAVEWKVGTEANVELTLITADARRLNCAHDDVIEGVHCGYNAAKRSWPREPGAPLDDNDERVIQPYRTADTNALVLASGLWAQPELAMRLHQEPPTYYDAAKQLRFVAYCKVRFVGELKDVAVRWETAGKWMTEASAIVAKPIRCTLEAPSG